MTFDQAPNTGSDSMPDETSDPQSEETRPRTPEQDAQRKQLQRIYITLILGGLAVGGVLSIVIVMVLRYFGLTDGTGG